MKLYADVYLVYYCLIYTACSINSPTCMKFIWCSYRILIDTLASEVKCLRVIERRDLSNERNAFKSKTIFYHEKTRLKPERATRPIPKRRPLYVTATRPIPKRRPLYVTATMQILNLSNLLKGSDIKKTSRRTGLLKGRNTRTIQLPLRHLKGISIGMTPLSDWLNVLLRGSGIAGVLLPPKGMSWHVVLH